MGDRHIFTSTQYPLPDFQRLFDLCKNKIKIFNYEVGVKVKNS